jgi:hypothetical protein
LDCVEHSEHRTLKVGTLPLWQKAPLDQWGNVTVVKANAGDAHATTLALAVLARIVAK